MFNSRKIKYLENDINILIRRVQDLEKQDFRLEIEQIKTQLISLRGLVNRKLGGDLPKSEESKDFNNTVLLPENGVTKNNY